VAGAGYREAQCGAGGGGAGVIALVRGPVLSLAPDGAVILVGGLGLQVFCTPATLAGLRVGDTASLSTALVVREDSLTLYGFANEDERGVFEALQTATGVGPRLAQAVLGVLRPDEIRVAIADEDLAALTRVPGIGRKVAQRIVLELKDRIGLPARLDDAAPAAVAASAAADDVRSGLLALGYSAREAESAVTTALEQHDGGSTDDPAALLRSALAVLRRT